ncbi:hypothetical protein AeMF1_008492 [Aphanomyces euteiches]|nr:hypothetical protein AeMF1_008492 [Aphanomyces euteiches]
MASVSAIVADLRLGGAQALKAVQRLVQSERVETVLAPDLVKLVSSGEPTLAVPSFLAFSKLCRNHDLTTHPLTTFDPTAVASTVSEHLTSADVRMQAAAALTLNNLAENQLALEPNVLERVVDAIEESDHESIQRALLGYIGNATASTEASRALVAETNCLSVLSELLQAGQSESLRSAAALAIGNVCSSRDILAQNQLRETGGLADLVLLLSTTYSEEANECSAWAISHGVHQNTLSQDFVGDAGAIGLLLKLVLSPVDDVRRNALMALHSSTIAHPVNLERCKKNNGDEIVQELLNDDVDECRTYAELLSREL